ncbi:MAG: DUF3987 domain-containing protein [Cyanobacteria bacterium P01_E01_bin.35]
MIDSTIILSIAAEKANPEKVTEYCEKLESFLSDQKNVTHPDFYDAKQHLSQCYDYLTLNEQSDKDAKKDRHPRSFSRKLAIPLPDLEEKVRNLTYENYTDEQLEGALLYLSREVNCTSYELRKYYDSVRLSEEREEFLSSTKTELEQIIKLERAKLNIKDYVPSPIATELLAYAKNLKVAPEACLTTLITALSVCNQIGTVLEIRPSQGFTVSPYLFSMIVAESGSMKSPILRTFAKKPIEAVQQGFIDKYKHTLAEYEQKIDEWDSMNIDDRKHHFPEGKPFAPDRPRLIYFGDKSMEAVNNQFDRYPEQALLYMKDEIAGLFNDADKYKNGKGSENTDLMSMFDGTAPPTIRADRGLVANPGTVGLSIFGTIQPEVLEHFWSDVIDPDGYWSRFLYCYQAKSLKSLPQERGGEESELPELLAKLFKLVNTFPAVAYNLDEDGYETYRIFYDFLARKSYEEVHPAISKAYSKALGLTGRLILNLHILDQASQGNGVLPAKTVPLKTVMKGINLMEFYMEQRLLLMKKLCNQDSISPHLKSLIEASQRLGWISAREVKQNIWHLKDTDPNKIRSWFQELENLGYGKTEGKGNRLKYSCQHEKPLQFGQKSLEMYAP